MTVENSDRNWRDIATEWIQEPNPGKMAVLAQELTKALDEQSSTPPDVAKVREMP